MTETGYFFGFFFGFFLDLFPPLCSFFISRRHNGQDWEYGLLFSHFVFLPCFPLFGSSLLLFFSLSWHSGLKIESWRSLEGNALPGAASSSFFSIQKNIFSMDNTRKTCKRQKYAGYDS